MPNLADYIEAYLKERLTAAGGVLEIQRGDLAEQFGCAPSQINYVLATRFSPERGYLVESRRGGGGYIRLIRLNLGLDSLHQIIRQRINDQVTQDAAVSIIHRLYEEQLITEREMFLMQAVVQRETIALDLPLRDMVRANLLKAMLLAVLRFQRMSRG